MVIARFPPVDLADEYGILGVGGDVEVETLLNAYRSGIFLWPVKEGQLVWFAPPNRAILRLKDFIPSASLVKERKRSGYSFRINTAFEEVVAACAEWRNRKGQKGTWITADVIKGYTALHYAGHCHSVECYYKDLLVGGLYGVSIGHMFAGESMFHRRPNASKLALWFLIDYLKERGIEWIDCQNMTDFLKQLGAIEISRDEFMKMLKESLSNQMMLFKVVK